MENKATSRLKLTSASNKTAEIKKRKRNDEEDVVLFSKKKVPEDACDLARIRQWSRKLAQMLAKYGQPSVSEVDFEEYWKDISDAFIGLGWVHYQEVISDQDHQPMETKFCTLCIEVLDHLMWLIKCRQDVTGAETHEMSDHTKKKETEDFSKVLEPQLEARLPKQKSMASVCTEILTARMVTDIAEKILLSIETKTPEDACALARIRWCRSKLAEIHDLYDRRTVFPIKIWKEKSEALIQRAWADYEKFPSDLEHQRMENMFCKLYIEILEHLVHVIEKSLNETGAKTREISDFTKREETEDFSKVKGQLEVLESDDIIATEMHRASIELALENQSLLLRALPYDLEDNKKSVHLYVYSGDRDTVEELKKKAKMKFSKFKAIIECTDLAVTPFKTPPINFPEKVEELDSETIKAINDYLQNNLCDFPSHRNVTAIMAGQKVSNSCYSNKPCITFYVMGKGRIPFGETELPSRLGNFDTDVLEGFVTELRSHRMLYHTVSRPLKLGVSVGVKGKHGAGTLGAIVKDSSNKMYVLSCEHVFNPAPGSENPQIEQPASDDYELHIVHLQNDLNIAEENGECEADLEYFVRKQQEVENSPPRVIGSYTTGIKGNVSFNGYKYHVDAALALLQLPEEEQARLINEGTKLCENKYTTLSYGPEGRLIEQNVNVTTANGNYKPLDDLSDDIKLHKCGRTTGLTVGKMIKEKIFVPMPAEREHEKFSHRNKDNLWYYNCMIITNGGKTAFSDEGDSGSLVLDEEGNAWALIFAGFYTNPGQWRSIACPIEVVLKELGQKINSKLTIIGNAPL